MPLSDVDRARLFLGPVVERDPSAHADAPNMYNDFEKALSEAHNLASGEAIATSDDYVCPGQLALYNAAKTISTKSFDLPERLQDTACMLGLAANDAAQADEKIKTECISHFYSAGHFIPEGRITRQTRSSGSADDMIDKLQDNLPGAKNSLAFKLITDFSDHRSNSRHAYDDNEQTGWWYQGGFLVERGSDIEFYCASANIGATFEKAWDKDSSSLEGRVPLLDSLVEQEAENFLGEKASRDLGAQIGYVMASSNDIGRLFETILKFSKAYNATASATLVSGAGQLTMNAAPGQYDGFEADPIGGETLRRLRRPVFSGNDFAEFSLGGTLIALKLVWNRS